MSPDAPLVIPATLLILVADGQIEEMPLEEYLKGVVPSELGPRKPIEALKAQAIAARSYAVTTRRHGRDGFDLCTTTHCQVWRHENHYAESDRAVDETAGQVVTLKGRIVATPFFGHCDGRTRNSEDVWSGKMHYCRSVPCICGYTKAYGHGVGLCQRGAIAMAKKGATASEILAHYYTDIEVTAATAIPREKLQKSLVVGRIVDGQGQPRSGLRLVLSGAEGRINKGTTRDGRFWFSHLPAGQWELKVKGKPVRYKDLRTDGRNTLELRVVVPDAATLATHTMPLAHPKKLVGTLGYDGVPVTIIDSTGNEQTVVSGSEPDFDPGGFAVQLPPPGACTLRVLNQSFDLEVGDIGLWVQFRAQAG
jgi:hypothetical protein